MVIILMASDNESSHPPSSIQWKIAKSGDEYVPYSEIESDPYLRERIKPNDGYKAAFDGHKYSVKVYDNGNILVFRKKDNPNTNIFYIQKENVKADNKLSDYHQDNEIVGDRNLNQKTDYSIETRLISRLKAVNIEEFHSEEGWDIFSRYPIVIVEDKIKVILAKLKPKVSTTIENEKSS